MAELEPFYRDLGRKIRELRMGKDMTQEELGNRLDPQLTRASIANIESGTQRVLAHTLGQLADQLEVSIQELFPTSKPLEVSSDEGATIAKELNRELKIPARR